MKVVVIIDSGGNYPFSLWRKSAVFGVLSVLVKEF